MLSLAFPQVLIPVIVIISIVLMVVRPRGIAEAYWIGGGASLLVLLRLVRVGLVGKAVAQGTDVYLFLAGMMLISELARVHGVFDWISSVALSSAQGSSSRLFNLVYGIGIVTTVFMSNDATAVVLTPAILAVVKKAKVRPLPYLFACALIANAASFVLPISNPANLVVYNQGVPPLGQWMMSFGVPSVLSILATYAVLRWIFRKELTGHMQDAPSPVPLNANGKLVLWGLGLMVPVLLAASAMNKELGLPTCLASIVIATAVSVRAKSDPRPLLKGVSWGTLALVAGLFVLVNAMESVGVLQLSRAALDWAQELGPVRGALATSFAVAVGNNFVNNLPLGLFAASTVQVAHARGLIVDAVLIGVDLGPNLSITGSLATILWLLALEKEQVKVSFWDFLKVGIFAMPIALFASMCGAMLIRIVFSGGCTTVSS